MFCIVEVVAPVQESIQLVFVHLRTQDSGSVTRLYDETVCYIHVLSGAIISPQLFRTFLQEWLNMVDCAYRLRYQTFFIEFVIGQRIHHLITFQIFFHNFFGCFIRIKLLPGRLVRNMEICHLRDPQFLQFRFQCCQELMQELTVFFSCCFCVPSKQLHQFSIFLTHNLRSHRCSPLAEQMRNLIIFDTTAFTHIYPSLELIETEGISVLCHMYIYQLYGTSLSTDCCIQRRGKYRRQQHVTFSFYGCAYKIFHNLPVFLTEHFHAVIICQTIRMKPLCVWYCQLRKFCIYYMNQLYRTAQNFSFHYHIHFYGMVSGSESCGVHIDPKTLPLSADQFHTPRLDLTQQIRIQTRFGGQIILICHHMCRIFTGNQADTSHTYLLFVIGRHLHLCSSFPLTTPVVSHLERYRLFFQCGDHIFHSLSTRLLIREHFFQRSDFFNF